jgi:hypothetical protein
MWVLEIAGPLLSSADRPVPVVVTVHGYRLHGRPQSGEPTMHVLSAVSGHGTSRSFRQCRYIRRSLI